MHPLRFVKTRLSTIPDNSLRYRMTSYIWKGRRVRNAKACTFYWVILPTSMLSYIGIGLFYLFAGVLVGIGLVVWTAVSWLCGYTVGFVIDKNTGSDTGQMYYPYKYHPRTGTTSRLAPWQILLPIVLLISAVSIGSTDTAGAIASASCGFAYLLRYVILGLTILIAGSYALGRYLTSNDIHPTLGLKRRWDRVCPPLKVEATPAKDLAEA